MRNTRYGGASLARKEQAARRKCSLTRRGEQPRARRAAIPCTRNGGSDDGWQLLDRGHDTRAVLTVPLRAQVPLPQIRHSEKHATRAAREATHAQISDKGRVFFVAAARRYFSGAEAPVSRGVYTQRVSMQAAPAEWSDYGTDTRAAQGAGTPHRPRWASAMKAPRQRAQLHPACVGETPGAAQKGSSKRREKETRRGRRRTVSPTARSRTCTGAHSGGASGDSGRGRGTSAA